MSLLRLITNPIGSRSFPRERSVTTIRADLDA
jgi:hypothetical protein